MHGLVLREVSFTHKNVWGKSAGGGLADVGVRVEPGKILCLLGSNGSGKSTMIRLLLGFLTPSKGSVQRPDGARISYVGDGGRNMYPDLNLMDNVRYALALRGMKPCRGLAQEVSGLCKAMMLDVGNMPVSSMSRGMRQKASIIAALVIPHDFLLADEPTLGLDHGSQAEFERLARCEAGLGRGICIATNDLSMAARIADDCVRVSGGRLVGGAYDA